MSDEAPPPNASPQRRDVCAPRSSPNSAWICGYAELGKCCASGPTSKGRCGLIAPATKSDDAAADDNELVPCIPRRGYRWRRQSLCLNLAILTGGVLLLCMTLPSRERTFVPGELSGKHAQILDNTLVSQRCGLCHPNSHLGAQVEQGVGAAFGGGLLGSGASESQHSQAKSGNEPERDLKFFGTDDGRQDALCMQCHKGHMPGALERTPHDLSASVLRALGGQEQTPAWQPVGNRPADAEPPDAHHAELAKTNCSDCHVEHHGRGFDLKAMADDRCQACHRRKFESFTRGHPEFKSFPAERPRSLAFSHRLHADKHFPQKNRDFDCRKCHLDHRRAGNVGPITRSVRFETACAECHQEPIRAATADGWAVLQLPSIDAAAADEGSELVHWPAEARFGFEGTVSPVLRALLEADEAAQQALASLPESGELEDIPAIGDQREKVTKSLALATERLIGETARDGQAAWRERLSKVTRARAGRELKAQEIALIEAMGAGLPPDLFRQMQSEWFERNGRPPADAKPTGSDRDSARAGDRAALTSATTQPALQPARVELYRRQPSRAQGIIIERKMSGLLVSDEAAADESASEQTASDDELLHEEPSAASSDLLQWPTADALLEPAEANGAKAHGDAPATPLAGARHLAGGGWYLDRETLALRYMPTGHADQTLAAWSLWWTLFHSAARPQDSSEGSRPTSEFSAIKSIPQQIPGGCIQCHRLSSPFENLPAHAGSLMAAWRVQLLPLGTREFTKFDHAPHLSLPAVSDCRYCHELRDNSPSAAPSPRAPSSYGRLVSALQQPHHAESDFRDMRLVQCVACHRPSGANSGCLQCHNYHVTPPPTNAANDINLDVVCERSDGG